jgi:L-asparaginase
LTEPALIIHGGTGARDAGVLSRIKRSLASIVERAYETLLSSDAVSAAAEAVRLMEDDELFNAGTGSRLQKDGKARLSASLMDGASQKFTGVINLEDIQNPILVSKLLLKEKHRVLSGAGAQEFALSHGFKKGSPVTEVSLLAWKKRSKGSDTVGACALDKEGKLASATSTGGIGHEIPGRVSDSAMPAGNFANAACAVSATGIGEEVIDECLAAKIVFLVTAGESLEEAFKKAFAEVRARKRSMGAVGLDRTGHFAWDTTSPELAFAWKKGSNL